MTVEKNGFTMIVEETEITISNKYGRLHKETCDSPGLFTEDFIRKVFSDFIEEHTVQAVSDDNCIKRVIKKESKFIQLQVVYYDRYRRFIAQFYDDEFTLMGSKGTGCHSYQEAEEWIRENYEVVRGLKVDVLRNPSWGDCTNGGISAKRDVLYLITEDVYEVLEDLRECVSLGCTTVNGKEYLHAKPIFFPNRWYSHGGNFLFNGNRVYEEVTGISYPIPIHDRYEGKSGTKPETVNDFNQASEE